VAVVDRSEETARAAATRAGGGAIGIAADLTRRDSVERAARDIRRRLGEVDILVNNAAAKSRNFFAPFVEFPIEDWNDVMASNVTTALLCCQVFGAAMARRGRGTIINIASIYGVVAPDQRIYRGSRYLGRPINTPAVYAASKAAVMGLTRYLAAYWGGRNVRVNAISPGGVESGQNETFVRRYSERVPLGRMARATELQGAIVYLASDASSYVTGHNLVVDGGWTAW
jgi:NAD(P)-dependent dehydrogenase (short-subunit alcohol dehydrogenase family)